MRIGIALLVAILASHARAEPQAPMIKEPMFIGGAGATRCDAWLEERQQKHSILSFGLKGWVLGFASGVNNGEGADGYLLNVSEDDVYSRVDFYCREHPSDILFQAAAMAAADLLRNSARDILKGRR
jgi:hypothetical protein